MNYKFSSDFSCLEFQRLWRLFQAHLQLVSFHLIVLLICLHAGKDPSIFSSFPFIWFILARIANFTRFLAFPLIIKIRRTGHAGHCWINRNELVSDVLLWTPSHGRAKEGRPAWIYTQQLCADTGCSPENLPEAMGDRQERVRDTCTTWWWLVFDWVWVIHLYIQNSR